MDELVITSKVIAALQSGRWIVDTRWLAELERRALAVAAVDERTPLGAGEATLPEPQGFSPPVGHAVPSALSIMPDERRSRVLKDLAIVVVGGDHNPKQSLAQLQTMIECSAGVFLFSSDENMLANLVEKHGERNMRVILPREGDPLYRHWSSVIAT